MADPKDFGLPSLQKLQSAEQMELLDVVDSLRACGLSEIVALPQLIVCGDQSSGKSSVLEAISGIPFPRQETLCTRFATEVILRRASKDEIKVSIVPGTERTQVDRDRLRQFHRELKTKHDFGDLFKDAGSEMGLSSTGRSFSNDILRVEFCGPSQPQLTLVDLPGLIHAQIESQTTGDVELVHNLVSRYLKSPRSIILAVVSAKNDISNQIILRNARNVDPQGLRTLGIITKPDVLVKGSKSEEAFIALARNEVVKFSLGWHVVKNIDSAIAQSQQSTRDQQETLFFQESNFTRLPAHTLGIRFLRARLSKVLFSQIREELPQLVKDIQTHISAAKTARDKLGPSRKELEQQRSFLISLSQSFHTICRDAVRGDYDHEFFQSDSNPERRLCATVMNMHFDFASNIRKNGASWLVDDENVTGDNCRTREEAIKEACILLKRSRGRELPGLPNPLLVGELFRQYSLPWGDLARMHIKDVWETTNRFLELLLRHLTDEDISDNIFRFWLHPIMEEKLDLAYSKLDELLEVHKDFPMTTNSHFINSSRRPRQDASKLNLESLRSSTPRYRQVMSSIDEPTLMLPTMNAKADTDLDMDMVAAEEAFDNMNAYYEVALNLFTDNVPTLAIQAPLIREVPKIFCPTAVDTMDPSVVNRIAGETEETIMERDLILHRLATLEKGALICRQYAKRPQHVLHLSSDEVDRSGLPASGSRAAEKDDKIRVKLPSTHKHFPESLPEDANTPNIFSHLSIPSQTSTPSPSSGKTSDLGQQERAPSPKPASAKPSTGLFNLPGNTTTKLSDPGTSSTTSVGLFSMPAGTPMGDVPGAASPKPAGGGNADTKPPYSGLFGAGSSTSDVKHTSGFSPPIVAFMEKQRKSNPPSLFGTAKPSTSMLDAKTSTASGSTTETSTSNALPVTSGLFGGKSPAKNDNSLKFPAKTETTATPRPRSTFGITFHPFTQSEPNSSTSELNLFQHISFLPGFTNFSCEEQRLEDYRCGLDPWWLKPPLKAYPVDFSQPVGNGK